jgi:4-alpha-glucanotransferase
VKKASEFYDLFRIDHMVGFFRTWVIPRDVALKPDFDIKDPQGQKERGRRFLQAVSGASHMLPVAEDLGLIPPYVGEVLRDLNVPGYKVMRWEKNKDGNYTDPGTYHPVSLATSSTHDNEPLAANSRIVILPIQDIFGSRERVNTPGTLGDHNWTYRFPTAAEDFLKKHADTAESFSALVKEKRK